MSDQADSGDPSSLLGLVFAGGQSRRMGRDKSLMPWPGPSGSDEPLFARAARVLAERCDEVVIAAGGSATVEAASGGRWAVLDDAERGAGPLAGLVAGLERAASMGFEGVLVLACDLPLVEAGDLDPLITTFHEGADVVLWTSRAEDGKSFDHPLFGIYRATAAGPARAALARGARRVVALLDEPAADGRALVAKRLHAGQNSAFRLVNVNTPSDYDRARLAAQSEHAPTRLVPQSDARADSGRSPDPGSTPGRPSLP